MENIYCQDRCAEPIPKENSTMEISDKTIIGVFTLIMIVFTAILWYEVSIGMYIDPTYL